MPNPLVKYTSGNFRSQCWHQYDSLSPPLECADLIQYCTLININLIVDVIFYPYAKECFSFLFEKKKYQGS